MGAQGTAYVKAQQRRLGCRSMTTRMHTSWAEVGTIQVSLPESYGMIALGVAKDRQQQERQETGAIQSSAGQRYWVGRPMGLGYHPLCSSATAWGKPALRHHKSWISPWNQRRHFLLLCRRQSTQLLCVCFKGAPQWFTLVHSGHVPQMPAQVSTHGRNPVLTACAFGSRLQS